MAIIDSLQVSKAVKGRAKEIYTMVANAESTVHGRPVGEVHFHELGMADAIADIVGTCLALEMLAPDKIVCSPVCTGTGTVQCAHGVLPVPAPATELLLQGMPWYGGEVQSELCTPTGAALLHYFAQEFGPMPCMTVQKSSNGLGTRQIPDHANLLRAFWGTAVDLTPAPAAPAAEPEAEEIVELCANLDDATPEQIAYAEEQLRAAGALDVFTMPIQMKKGRAAVMVSALCRPGDRAALTDLLFEHTPTLGVRYNSWHRDFLSRKQVTVDTPYGPIRVKVSQGHGVTHAKPEYDDCAAAAQKAGVSLDTVQQAALRLL